MNMENFGDRKFFTGFDGAETLHFRLRRRTFTDCDSCTPSIGAPDLKLQAMNLNVETARNEMPEAGAIPGEAGPNDVQVFDFDD